MIIKREKIITKKISIFKETYKRTSYWLFGIIPLYIKDEFIQRSIR